MNNEPGYREAANVPEEPKPKAFRVVRVAIKGAVRYMVQSELSPGAWVDIEHYENQYYAEQAAKAYYKAECARVKGPEVVWSSATDKA